MFALIAAEVVRFDPDWNGMSGVLDTVAVYKYEVAGGLLVSGLLLYYATRPRQV